MFMKRRAKIGTAIITVATLFLTTACENTSDAERDGIVSQSLPLVPDFVIDGDLNNTLPEKGVIYVVTVNKSSAGNNTSTVLFEFAGILEKEQFSGSTFEARQAEFELWVADYVKLPKKLKKIRKRCQNVGDSPNGATNPKCTKRDNSLSASNSQELFLAFVLDPKIRNWRFIEEIRTEHTNPFKYEDEVIKIGYDGDKAHYGNLRKVDNTGKFYDRNVNPSSGENVVGAYFVADGDTRVQQSYDYKDSFNLYVEMLDADGEAIPIIVDPDVRWPGGNDGG